MADGQQMLPTDGMGTESASESPEKLKMEGLVHALECKDAKCTLFFCRKGKWLVLHNQTCKIKASGGCAPCKILIRLCRFYFKKCLEKDDCPRSLYIKIKMILKQKHQVASRVTLQSLHRSNNAGSLSTYVPEAVKPLNSQQQCDMSHGFRQNISTLQQQQMGYGYVLQQQQQQQGSTMMNYQPPSWENTIQQLDSQQQYDISHGLLQNVSTLQQQQSGLDSVQQLQGSMMKENQLPRWENQVQQLDAQQHVAQNRHQQQPSWSGSPQHQTLNSWGQQFASHTYSGTESSPAPTRAKIYHTDGWEQAIQSGVRVIKHASCCDSVACPEPGCLCLSKLLLHFIYCGSCNDCKYFICVAYRHAEQCHDTNCLVPLCSKRKQKIALQQYAQGQGVGKQKEESMGSTPKIENLSASKEDKMMRQRLALIKSINLALEHAPQCKDEECKVIFCSRMKKITIHYAMNRKKETAGVLSAPVS